MELCIQGPGTRFLAGLPFLRPGSVEMQLWALSVTAILRHREADAICSLEILYDYGNGDHQCSNFWLAAHI